jgi:DNA-binding NarL/FixJ family response regulator
MPEARSVPRVVLADDDVLLREGLASLLDHSGFEVVGQAGNGTELLALMAEGASNAGIARRIVVTEGTVEKHVRSILTKLDLPESDAEHRRVLAVLRFLDAR